ncbi:MAG: hypothetical protein NTW87_26905 [Planctomycetota bacterium]|nr:hypothetical protein [Planctomycetota bacterium]
MNADKKCCENIRAHPRLSAVPKCFLLLLVSAGLAGALGAGEEKGPSMTLSWADNILKIHGDKLPGGVVEILYLEAYCRPGSTDREWGKTVIGHRTELVSRSADGTQLKLRCELKDGVVVDHVIAAREDEVDFRLQARNPTDKASEAHWVQPCMRVGEFTGCGKDADAYAYLKKCFIFVDGSPHRLPTPEWATQARYTPGQVWCPKHVPRDDVNPRPLSKLVPSNGLIGCFSADEKMVLATASEPYQELFQGVIRCIHSDFRIGGLAPGEKKDIRGKIYIVPADIPALLQRYEKDFPEHKK